MQGTGTSPDVGGLQGGSSNNGARISVAILAQAFFYVSVVCVGGMVETWRLTAIWMSGRTWQFDMPPTSAICQLRRRVMLAAGGMQRRVMVAVANTTLEGDGELGAGSGACNHPFL